MTTNAPVVITAKYFIDQVLYVIFYPTLEIRPVQIKKVHLDTDGTLRYYVIVKDDIWSRVFEDMKEEELHLFADAKATLLAFLTLKVNEINSMSQPV